MSVVMTCATCTEPMVTRPRHRGHEVHCPRCDASLDVPAGLAYRPLTDAAVRDRTNGRWMLMAAILAAVAWLAPLSAFLWWYCQGRISRAKKEGRHPVADLVAARVLAMVATAAQILSYVELALVLG